MATAHKSARPTIKPNEAISQRILIRQAIRPGRPGSVRSFQNIRFFMKAAADTPWQQKTRQQLEKFLPSSVTSKRSRNR